MKKIQVCGDPTLDWLLAENPNQMDSGGTYFWLSRESIPKLHLGSQPGGSALMCTLVRKMVSGKADVQGIELDKRMLRDPIADTITNSWTIWRAYEDKALKKPVFRIKAWTGYEPGHFDYIGSRPEGHADLLLIEDSGLGFRDCEEGWPEALSPDKEKPEYIILKIAKFDSGENNKLIRRIHDLGMDRHTTMITAINDLRSGAVRIGPSLSWEKLFDEVVAAVCSEGSMFYDGSKKELLYDRIIVSIGASGAVIVGRDHQALVFDRSGQEGDFSHRHPGEMMGMNTCLMGALAARWAGDEARMDWNEAVRDGIGLARFLNVNGYEVVNQDGRNSLRFPVDSVEAQYRSRRSNMPGSDPHDVWDLEIYIDRRTDKSGANSWSILEESVKFCCDQGAGQDRVGRTVCGCAKSIVRKGPRSTLRGVPVESVGAWTSADRNEIEGIRSVNNAFRNYLTGSDRQESPLCIAVFGPPGSGKSFAIKEIAKGLGIDKGSQLTFNLSQFESSGQLPDAFHSIRDLQLSGKVPLVFWDEFDTPLAGRQLGWLRYFLAPMQDGEFTENGRTHPIGRCIFVFAGGTRHSFEEFCAGGSQEEIAAKKPDFISRLKAYIDIKGPNGNPNTIEDKLYIIRRAFLLNHFLNTYSPMFKNSEGELQIEDGVLDALLRTGSYRHGARSMEALIKMSTVAGKRKHEYSCLPPDQILGMHVDIDKFLLLTKLGGRETLRIGVTGHINLPDEIGVIKKCLDEAVTFIEEHYPNRLCNVLSMLALGSDRLAANRILQMPGASLTAVLPVPKDDFINDFGVTDNHFESYTDAENRQEFRYYIENRADEVIELPAAPTRDDAYLAAGRYIAENCDLLIAVWDGRPAQGRGGAGDIAAYALEHGKPIIHVWAGNNKRDPEKRTDVGNMLGKFRYRNIPGAADNW